jgi:hypothetical protein
MISRCLHYDLKDQKPPEFAPGVLQGQPATQCELLTRSIQFADKSPRRNR